MPGSPPAEILVDASLVRNLLEDQHPDLAHLPIALVDAGWDNFMFRLGETMTVRLPRRGVGAGLIGNEQMWLPVLAKMLPLPVPAPIRIGVPDRSFPWAWSVIPWFDGAPACDSALSRGEALTLATFLKAMHHPAPDNAPTNLYRGGPLRDWHDMVSTRLKSIEPMTKAIHMALEEAWTRGVDAKPSDTKCWLHGDLHARNVLVENGRISAIIDWGDITSGDVATDLAGIWALFDEADARHAALETYGADDQTVARARGWAVYFGSVLLETGSVDNPRHAKMGWETLARVAADIS